MEFLLALIGGEFVVGIIFFALLAAAGDFLWSSLGTIITWIFYIIFGCTAICGLYKIKEHVYKREIVAGILVFFFGAAGIFSVADAEGINDYIKQKTVENEEKLLAKSNYFLSFENSCKSEEIESIEIKYIYDKKHDKYITGKNSRWQQVYPSKGRVYTPEKIPYKKSNYLFTVRITTKDNNKSHVEKYNSDFSFYNIIYFGNSAINRYEGIDVMDEQNVNFIYNGYELLINSKKAVIKESESIFSNTLIHWIDSSYYDGKQYPAVLIRSEEDVKRGYGNYHSFNPKEQMIYSRSDFIDIPNEFDITHLDSGKTYLIVYNIAGQEKDSKEITAKDFNKIEIRDDKIYISYDPDFCKFEFLK